MTDCNTKLSRPISVDIPSEVLNKLVDLIVELSERGEIRKTDDERYSVFNVINIALGKKGERTVWERLQSRYPVCVTFCDSYVFGGRGGYQETPVTDLAETVEAPHCNCTQFSVGMNTSELRKDDFNDLQHSCNN